MRTYDELITLKTFDERFKYLLLSGVVGEETFGFDRYLNQKFYTSYEWKRIRREVIVRDEGCEMGLKDYPINGKILIHHMNPITVKDIKMQSKDILNPNFLVCVSKRLHNAIHYGDESVLLFNEPVVRTANDTCPWK